MAKNFLEDLKQLWFLDLAVSRTVHCLQELLYLVLADLPSSAHVVEGSVDELTNLVSVQTVVLVRVVLVEDGVDCVPELLIGVGHALFNKSND